VASPSLPPLRPAPPPKSATVLVPKYPPFPPGHRRHPGCGNSTPGPHSKHHQETQEVEHKRHNKRAANHSRRTAHEVPEPNLPYPYSLVVFATGEATCDQVAPQAERAAASGSDRARFPLSLSGSKAERPHRHDLVLGGGTAKHLWGASRKFKGTTSRSVLGDGAKPRQSWRPSSRNLTLCVERSRTIYGD